MNKDSVYGAIVYIVIVLAVTVLVWTVGKWFSDTVSDHKVIYPKEGVECVVVSRMFNTSVDCWLVNKD